MKAISHAQGSEVYQTRHEESLLKHHVRQTVSATKSQKQTLKKKKQTTKKQKGRTNKAYAWCTPQHKARTPPSAARTCYAQPFIPVTHHPTLRSCGYNGNFLAIVHVSATITTGVALVHVASISVVRTFPAQQTPSTSEALGSPVVSTSPAGQTLSKKGGTGTAC